LNRRTHRILDSHGWLEKVTIIWREEKTVSRFQDETESETTERYLCADEPTGEADTRSCEWWWRRSTDLGNVRIRTLGLSASGVLLFVDVVLVAPPTMASAGLRTAPRARIIQSSTLALRRPALGARLLSTRTAPVRDALRPARPTG
jgi:hypothetical protein